MAHPDHLKAQALAMLALGDTPRYVAEQLGIPRTTVRRWQGEARALLADVLSDADRAILVDLGRQIAAVFPGLLQQNGPKNKKWADDVVTANVTPCMGYPMVHGVIKQRFKRRDGRTCGAKTRAGHLCKNAPIGFTGRCRMHGGKSFGGIASPRFKHGRNSKYLIARLAGAYLERTSDD